MRDFKTSAGNESPTTGYRPVDQFHGDATAGAHRQDFTTGSVTAKYFKAVLLDTPGTGVSVNRGAIRLSNSQSLPTSAPDANLLSAGAGREDAGRHATRSRAQQTSEHIRNE